jgi:hypothetical protein
MNQTSQTWPVSSLGMVRDAAVEIVEMDCLVWQRASHQHIAAAGMADIQRRITQGQSA